MPSYPLSPTQSTAYRSGDVIAEMAETNPEAFNKYMSQAQDTREDNKGAEQAKKDPARSGYLELSR